MTVSSAYINTLEACQQLGRSVTYNEDSNGPSIEPRGTPQTTCWRLDRTPPTKADGCGQLGNQTSKDVHTHYPFLLRLRLRLFPFQDVFFSSPICKMYVRKYN